MLEKVKFENFTCFERLEIECSPGINIFLGENGTGKTHILKAAYAACDVAKVDGDFAQKINNVFYPAQKQIGRLVKRSQGSSRGFVEVTRKFDQKRLSLRLSLTNHAKKPDSDMVSGATRQWTESPIRTAYIPVKDMMANAPGFRSLYQNREIHFEEIYVDIIDKLFLPIKRGPLEADRKQLLLRLQKAMDGKVVIKNEEFFLKNKQGELEFTLLAEGYRKLGLLWLLIQNGTLLEGSVLFWDEPEANLNPKLLRTIVEILIVLQRLGTQIFIATHDYVSLKEFDLQLTVTDKVKNHTLFRDTPSSPIQVATTDSYADITPSAIDDAFASFVDREITRSMGRLGK